MWSRRSSRCSLKALEIPVFRCHAEGGPADFGGEDRHPVVLQPRPLRFDLLVSSS